MKTLGERISSRRIELGLTQEELAKRVGYENKTSINMIESNKRDLPRSKVIPIANALHVSIDYIMGWDEKIEEDRYSILKRELGIIDFTDDEKKEIINYIKYIISLRNK